MDGRALKDMKVNKQKSDWDTTKAKILLKTQECVSSRNINLCFSNPQAEKK